MKWKQEENIGGSSAEERSFSPDSPNLFLGADLSDHGSSLAKNSIIKIK